MVVQLSTIQKQYKRNLLFKNIDENNPNSNYLYYVFENNNSDNKEPIGVLQIQNDFLDKDGNLASIKGVTIQDLLEIVRDRLIDSSKTKEEDNALTHVEEALMWLNKLESDKMELYKNQIKNEKEGE
jgi:lysyl-tRNA synthetase class I